MDLVDKKMRVLIIAEAANPEWTSVPLLGWLHTRAMADLCSVHLVTQIRNKEAIERAGWVEGVQFTAIDNESLAQPMYRLSTLLRGGKNLAWTISTALQSILYPYFEFLVWRRFKSELEMGEFDIVHRVTPVSPTVPSYLAKKLRGIGVPFIVGPINGGVPWPAEFRDVMSQEKEWLSVFRSAYKLLPGYRSLRKNCSAIICGSTATLSQLPDYTKGKSFYIPENAVDTRRFSKFSYSDFSSPLKAIFIGRLVPYKGVDMAIEAMAEFLRQGKIQYDIYGSGPEENRLKSLISKLQLEDSVSLHGFVDNTKLQDELESTDLLVFPSIREFGGGVVLESMAMGIVPVVADYAGPSDLVSEYLGYKIPMGERAVMVKSLKAILGEIIDNPEVLDKKRLACREKIKTLYTWEQKTKQVTNIYNWCLGRAERPNYNLDFFNNRA